MNEQDRSILVFVGLLVALSAPFWLLEAIHPVALLPGLPSSALSAFMPAVTALILSWKRHGTSGAAALLWRAVDFARIRHLAWYAVILLTNPLIAIIAFFIERSNEAIPGPAPITFMAVALLLIFFIGALGEELGWSGYLTEPLVRRMGVWGAGLSLGVIWAVWHYIALLQAHRDMDWIGWWTLFTVSLRVIMVWLYLRCGASVAAVASFHAVSNLCWQLFPIHGSYYDPKVFGLVAMTVALVIAAFDRFRRA